MNEGKIKKEHKRLMLSVSTFEVERKEQRQKREKKPEDAVVQAERNQKSKQVQLHRSKRSEQKVAEDRSSCSASF